MKLLPSAPLTDEDFAILMCQWDGRNWLRPTLIPHGHSVWCDRRDAELMFRLVRGGCSLCLGEVAHTAECVGWRWESRFRLRPPHEM
jgi:hypothetical protein